MSEFQPWPKMARWSRDIVITEKLDGTNSQILIDDASFQQDGNGPVAIVNGLGLWAGSRSRWLDTTSRGDNFGFAKWVQDNAEELFKLGEGRHFGEWWGKGIQRGYAMEDKRFSLFNASRWRGEVVPACCHVVPILYDGPNNENNISAALHNLKEGGSAAAPGFMNPEGIIIWHTAANIGFKKTIDNDHQAKGQV